MSEVNNINSADKGVYGIHHVTAITSDPQKNIDFYTNTLGLRLVKITVNQDDPTSYHIYYGDEVGNPGTVLTFFHWPNITKGLRGASEVHATSFQIPEQSTNYWKERLEDRQVIFRGPYKRFGQEQVIILKDPDGHQLELIANQCADSESTNLWKEGSVPSEHAIRRFHSVTLAEEEYEQTTSILTEKLGFNPTKQEGNRFRFEINNTVNANKEFEGIEKGNEKREISGANIVDIICVPNMRRALIGIGSVHHVAWRTPTDEQQKVLRHNLVTAGLTATPVIDRFYFKSVYFREPGGVLFEIATNPPGFTVDEKEEELGTKLVLPPWLEPNRKVLEKVLPPVNLPSKSIVHSQSE